MIATNEPIPVQNTTTAIPNNLGEDTNNLVIASTATTNGKNTANAVVTAAIPVTVTDETLTSTAVRTVPIFTLGTTDEEDNEDDDEDDDNEETENDNDEDEDLQESVDNDKSHEALEDQTKSSTKQIASNDEDTCKTTKSIEDKRTENASKENGTGTSGTSSSGGGSRPGHRKSSLALTPEDESMDTHQMSSGKKDSIVTVAALGNFTHTVVRRATGSEYHLMVYNIYK
ncbi:secreted acidic protein 2-like [Teleopsis dalmanni]|uniref:secreted acidic protein 2-like n=1 Tax=Teleopsis dalmanni TaxID=139649 RepID=UPI0018CE47B5|nr:secreted acidic protein 2-like [Teleopsis dalmanni]